jgi:hypothetical protein
MTLAFDAIAVRRYVDETIIRPHVYEDSGRPKLETDPCYFHYIDAMCFISRVSEGLDIIANGFSDEDIRPFTTARDFYKALVGKLPLTFYAQLDGANKLLKLSTDDTTGKEITIGSRRYWMVENIRDQVPYPSAASRANVYERIIKCVTRDMSARSQMGDQGWFDGIEDAIRRLDQSIKDTADFVFQTLTGIDPNKVMVSINEDGTYNRLVPYLVNRDATISPYVSNGHRLIAYEF